MNTDLILVWPTSQCGELLSARVVPWDSQRLPEFNWRPRREVEDDAEWQQPIAYVVLKRKSLVWAYRRKGGDGRLDGRVSIGVGGHVDPVDQRPAQLETLLAAASREMAEELANGYSLNQPRPMAWIHEHESAVGLVHLGFVCCIEWDRDEEPQVRRGEKLESLGFVDPSRLPEGTELWSRLAWEALQ